jgi:hypothetical protein
MSIHIKLQQVDHIVHITVPIYTNKLNLVHLNTGVGQLPAQEYNNNDAEGVDVHQGRLDLTHETGHPEHESTSAASCFKEQVDANSRDVVSVMLLPKEEVTEAPFLLYANQEIDC